MCNDCSRMSGRPPVLWLNWIFVSAARKLFSVRLLRSSSPWVFSVPLFCSSVLVLLVRSSVAFLFSVPSIIVTFLPVGFSEEKGITISVLQGFATDRQTDRRMFRVLNTFSNFSILCIRPWLQHLSIFDLKLQLYMKNRIFSRLGVSGGQNSIPNWWNTIVHSRSNMFSPSFKKISSCLRILLRKNELSTPGTIWIYQTKRCLMITITMIRC